MSIYQVDENRFILRYVFIKFWSIWDKMNVFLIFREKDSLY